MWADSDLNATLPIGLEQQQFQLATKSKFYEQRNESNATRVMKEIF